jgi:hypothetical protein
MVVVKLLLEKATVVNKSAFVNMADINGTTALGVAATAEIATMLIAHGATVDLVNSDGQTALWLALQKDREDVAVTLAEAGASNKVDSTGSTPLAMAADHCFWSVVLVLARSDRLDNVDSVNNRGESALWLAVMNGREDVVDALVEKGADVNKADVNGVAPLSVAPTVTIATALLESGAHVDAVNKRGESALWLAVQRIRKSPSQTFHVDVAVALIKAGATNKAASNGVTCLPLIVAIGLWCWRWRGAPDWRTSTRRSNAVSRRCGGPCSAAGTTSSRRSLRREPTLRRPTIEDKRRCIWRAVLGTKSVQCCSLQLVRACWAPPGRTPLKTKQSAVALSGFASTLYASVRCKFASDFNR